MALELFHLTLMIPRLYHRAIAAFSYVFLLVVNGHVTVEILILVAFHLDCVLLRAVRIAALVVPIGTDFDALRCGGSLISIATAKCP